ncbi:hypothetical protein BK816_07955 [Boudabousia tangfeifanii]|uniref:Uncharacterized protein n=1 Tax=Boudabousia tangfeifanii TaxID=1912795 RepID=A0A1D9MLW0_9ACTO|nr:hypothetical protein BK816_07955 [Boudabousia tangfeifanii]
MKDENEELETEILPAQEAAEENTEAGAAEAAGTNPADAAETTGTNPADATETAETSIQPKVSAADKPADSPTAAQKVNNWFQHIWAKKGAKAGVGVVAALALFGAGMGVGGALGHHGGPEGPRHHHAQGGPEKPGEGERAERGNGPKHFNERENNNRMEKEDEGKPCHPHRSDDDQPQENDGSVNRKKNKPQSKKTEIQNNKPVEKQSSTPETSPENTPGAK